MLPHRSQRPASTRTRKTPSRWPRYFFNGLLGLVPAVRAYIRELKDRTPARIVVAGPIRESPLSDDAELAAYRIVQEALSNARRHAEASEIRVTFRADERGLHIIIEDDGVGFIPPDGATVRKEEALGLLGMQERAAYVGGRAEIHSAPGVGTRVEIHLPPQVLPIPPLGGSPV